MTREWKPGDVAMVDGQVAMIYNDGSLRATFVYTDADGDPCSIYARDADTRPLVMIDPEDREQVERLYASWLDNLAAPEREAQVNAMQAALREFADPQPPRIDEPGTWGVVEASCVHSDERRKWVRHEDDNWWPAEKYSHAEVMVHKGRDPRLPDGWDDLVDPVLVREGVAS